MQAIAAQHEAITNHVYMKEVVYITGANNQEEAVTAVRAITNAMFDIMTLTGAPDTQSAVETVKEIVMVLKEVTLRRHEERVEELRYAS